MDVFHSAQDLVKEVLDVLVAQSLKHQTKQ